MSYERNPKAAGRWIFGRGETPTITIELLRRPNFLRRWLTWIVTGAKWEDAA